MKKEKLLDMLTQYLFLIFLVILTPVEAQEGNGSESEKIIDLEFVVEDEQGNPIYDAKVFLDEGARIQYSDATGKVKTKIEEGSIFLLEKSGYESMVIDLSRQVISSSITMKELPVYTGENAILRLPHQNNVSKRRNVGAIGEIEANKLGHYTDPLLSNKLQGQGLGLIARMNAGGMNNNPASLYIRGLSRMSDNGIITIVDGIERPIDDLIPEEIESIELLKDATSKMTYGPRAANGVLMVTTRRGEANKRVIRASADYGIGQPTRIPRFIGAHAYASLYNEARLNDGFEPFYSNRDLEGYENSTGPNDFRYPDVDYYDYFLKSHSDFMKVTSEFSGGNDIAQYAVVGGFLQSTGLEDVGRTPTNTRFNFRGNLDVKINEIVSANMGVAAIIDSRNLSSVYHSGVFSSLSTHRPNEYPLIVDEDIIPRDSLGIRALGTSFSKTNNLYGDMKYGGFIEQQYISGQTNLGFDFDFNTITEGLSAKGYVTFDNYFFGSEVQNKTASTYARRWIPDAEGQDSLLIFQLQEPNYNDDVRLMSNDNFRNAGWNASLNYSRTFGNNNIETNLGYFYYQREQNGMSQNTNNATYFFRSNFMNNNKYIAELSFAYMGSDKFERGNRFDLFPSAGLAWVISEERFLNDNRVFDYLKFKVSAGILGYDASTNHYLYEQRWSDTGNVSFGEQNNTNVSKISFNQIGNSGLGWEKSREINVGIEGVGLNHRLVYEVNYFDEFRYDIILSLGGTYPSVYGSHWYPNVNAGEVKNRGFEFLLNWEDRIDGFQYRIGTNLVWSKNKVIEEDEIPHFDENLRSTGKSSDVMFGYRSLGLFGKDVDIADHPVQAFGEYGDGDIAYKDINEDGVVNELDREIVGNSFPRTSLGLNIDLSYNGWGLNALGTAEIGVSNMLNNSYYWMRGEDKYSELAIDRYHAENNPEGTYPRLTTTNGNNNFRNSDFWIENTNFFRLKNLELSYTFQNKGVTAIARQIKLYARGSNLFVLSNVDDLDPEALNAGISNYPVMSFISGGISVSF